MRATDSNSTTASLKSLLSRLSGIRAGNTARHESRHAPGDTQHVEYTGKDPVDCGGYNEAFVMQYWTGYNPRH